MKGRRKLSTRHAYNTPAISNSINPAGKRRRRREAASANPEQLHAYIESWQWLGRSGLPVEVGQACYFLASDEASFITGVELIVSGGAELGFGPKERVDFGLLP